MSDTKINKQKVHTQNIVENNYIVIHQHGEPTSATVTESVLPPANHQEPSSEIAEFGAREECQKQQFASMCEKLEGQDELLRVLSEEIKACLPDKECIKMNAESVIYAFNKLANDIAIECIGNVFIRFWQESKHSQARSVGQFAKACLPVFFDFDHHLSGFRDDLRQSSEDRKVIESPTKLPVPTEMMMAAAESKPVNLKLFNNKLGSPFDLGVLAEAGLDEDGSEAARQMNELLKRRFLKADSQDNFEKGIDSVVFDISKPHDYGSALVGKKAGLLSRNSVTQILNNMYKLSGRSYYYCFKAAQNFNPKVLEQLSRDYPPLAFLLSRCAEEGVEEQRFSFLSHIIAVGEGALAAKE